MTTPAQKTPSPFLPLHWDGGKFEGRRAHREPGVVPRVLGAPGVGGPRWPPGSRWSP